MFRKTPLSFTRRPPPHLSLSRSFKSGLKFRRTSITPARALPDTLRFNPRDACQRKMTFLHRSIDPSLRRCIGGRVFPPCRRSPSGKSRKLSGRESRRKFSQTASARGRMHLLRKYSADGGFTYYNASGDSHRIINMITACAKFCTSRYFRVRLSRSILLETLTTLLHSK